MHKDLLTGGGVASSVKLALGRKGAAVRRMMSKLLGSKRGATSVEYGLICALIVLVMLVGLRNFAGSTINMWSNVNSAVQNAH